MKKVSFIAGAMIMLVASCSKKTSAPTAAKKMYNGANLFANNCARCHGAEGTNDTRTPNLHTITLDHTQMVDVITHGKNHMPSFEDKLSAGEISALADLIGSWRNK